MESHATRSDNETTPTPTRRVLSPRHGQTLPQQQAASCRCLRRARDHDGEQSASPASLTSAQGLQHHRATPKKPEGAAPDHAETSTGSDSPSTAACSDPRTTLLDCSARTVVPPEREEAVTTREVQEEVHPTESEKNAMREQASELVPSLWPLNARRRRDNDHRRPSSTPDAVHQCRRPSSHTTSIHVRGRPRSHRPPPLIMSAVPLTEGGLRVQRRHGGEER